MGGGSLSTQPTYTFGITGNDSKYLGSTTSTLLTALYKRQRHTSLAADDGETSMTFEITVAATVSGGSSPSYKARPYWVIRVVEDE
jgi:hypothetical protein